MLQRIVAIVFILLAPYGKLWAHVDKVFFLKGTLGNRSIAIKMLNYDETRTRHLYYYFADDRKDHFLTGTYQNKNWLFTNATSTVTLTIADNTNGVWQANYTDSTGINNALSFTTLTAEDCSNNFSHLPYVTELDPYERNRLANVHFTPTNTTKLSKQLSCQWMIDKPSGIAFFRLQHHDKKIATDSINAALETIQLTYLQQYYTYNATRTNMQVATTILYHNNALISFNTTATTTSKQQPTQTNRQLLTLHINNGLQVNLEDIVWCDSATNQLDATNLFSVYKYRKNIFAPAIFKLLQQRYPTQMQSSQCNINQVASWALPDWCLTNKGLAFGFRNEEGCEVFSWSILPYSSLSPYITTAYQYLLKVK